MVIEWCKRFLLADFTFLIFVPFQCNIDHYVCTHINLRLLFFGICHVSWQISVLVSIIHGHVFQKQIPVRFGCDAIRMKWVQLVGSVDPNWIHSFGRTVQTDIVSITNGLWTALLLGFVPSWPRAYCIECGTGLKHTGIDSLTHYDSNPKISSGTVIEFIGWVVPRPNVNHRSLRISDWTDIDF